MSIGDIQRAHDALELVKHRHREDHSGGCRMLSKGDDCDCTLCLCDRAHCVIRDLDVQSRESEEKIAALTEERDALKRERDALTEKLNRYKSELERLVEKWIGILGKP